MPLHDFRVTPFVTDHTGDTPARVREWRDTRRMFETTAVVSKKRGWRGVFWGMLPFSLATHVMVVVGIVAVQTWEVTFPGAPPPMIEGYRLLVAVPLPPPPPPPPPAASAVRIEKVQRLPDDVAPNAIPDEIPELLPTQVSQMTGFEGGVEGGVEGGEIGGGVGGVEGGVTPVEPPPPPDTIVVARDERLPLRPISMNYPMYPEKWRNRRVEDTLVMKYRIDKKGRVADAIILQAPQYKEFSEESLKAIRSWRFQPLVINGEPKEIVHELTIYFKIEKPKERAPRAADGPKLDKPGRGLGGPLKPGRGRKRP